MKKQKENRQDASTSKKNKKPASTPGVRKQAAAARRKTYGDQSRRMSSITRKLHFLMVRKKLWLWLLTDLLFFFLVIINKHIF